MGPTLKAAAVVTETISHLVTSISYQGNVTGPVLLLAQQEDATKQLIIRAETEERGFISQSKNTVIVYPPSLYVSVQTGCNILQLLQVNKEITMGKHNRDLLQDFIVDLYTATENKSLCLPLI